MNQPRFWGAALWIALWVLLGEAEAQSPLQALYKAARAEGKVTVWSPITEVGDILAKEFEKEFPGVKVDFFEIREDFEHESIYGDAQPQ